MYDYSVYVKIWVCLKFCCAAKDYTSNCIHVCAFDNLKGVCTHRFNTSKYLIYLDLYVSLFHENHVYTRKCFEENAYKKLGFFLICMVSLISIFVFPLSINEVLIDDLGLRVVFFMRIEWLKNDEATSCLWLKIRDGSVIIS